MMMLGDVISNPQQSSTKSRGFLDSFNDFLTRGDDQHPSLADSIANAAGQYVNAKANAKIAQYNAKATKYGGAPIDVNMQATSRDYRPNNDTFNASDLVGGKSGMVLLAVATVAGGIYFATRKKKAK